MTLLIIYVVSVIANLMFVKYELYPEIKKDGVTNEDLSAICVAVFFPLLNTTILAIGIFIAIQTLLKWIFHRIIKWVCE